jgi:uncharacterized protein YjbJ (UPF0337 family)
MNPTEDILPGKWHELKGQVRRQWRKVTVEDLTRLSGASAELAGILQQRYGYGKAHAYIEIKSWLLKNDPQSW